MKAKVKWIGEELFLGTSESGHTVVLDANGGKLAHDKHMHIWV